MSKILYEKPSTELLVLRFEEGILTGSPVYGDPGEAGGEIGNGETYNL